MEERYMKSAWVTGKNRIDVREQDISPPGPGEVLVKIKACGICGTDLHFYHDYPKGTPIPLGHEVSGIVEDFGSSVTGLKKGDMVVVQNNVICGRCSSCLNGEWDRCLNIQTYMNDRAGMAEYLAVPRDMVLPFESLDFVQAAVAEPVTVALDLMKQADLDIYQDVLVSGPGIIGLSCVRLAKLSGARRVAVLGRAKKSPRGRKRLEAAFQMGADRVYDTDEPGWKEEIKGDFTRGFQRVIITSPPSTIPATLDLAAFGAWVVYNGISFSDETLSFNANSFHFKKLRLIASHAIPNWGFPRAFDLIRDKQIDTEHLVTHIFTFPNVEDAVKTASSRELEVIKVIVTF